MGGRTAVVERGVSIIDNLSEDEGLVLLARCEGDVGRLVAKVQLGGLGHCVIVGTPNELDSVPDGCVEGERHIAKNTLCGGDPDSVGRTTTRAATVSRRRGHGRRHVGSGRSAELSNTLLHTAVIAAAAQT